MTEIYYARLTPLYAERIFGKSLLLLPELRRKKIERYRHLEDRCRSLGAGLLLEEGLRRRGFTLLDGVRDCKKIAIVEGEHGKPYFSGCRELFFNMSHAGNYAVAAFSEKEIGVDIECLGRYRESIVRRFFCEDEKAYLDAAEDTEQAFLEIWTKKESYIKALGRGISLPLDSFSSLESRPPIRTWSKPEGYCISACGSEVWSAKLFELDFEVDFEKLFDGIF
ncbi:MAG: 4'-phosphopantetheinyl transferase family protein [Roseburia sp.]